MNEQTQLLPNSLLFMTQVVGIYFIKHGPPNVLKHWKTLRTIQDHHAKSRHIQENARFN